MKIFPASSTPCRTVFATHISIYSAELQHRAQFIWEESMPCTSDQSRTGERIPLFTTHIGEDIPRHDSVAFSATLQLDEITRTRAMITVIVVPKAVDLNGATITIEVVGGESISRPLSTVFEATFPKLPVREQAEVYLTLPPKA